MSVLTLSKAVSVEWLLLYVDCNSYQVARFIRIFSQLIADTSFDDFGQIQKGRGQMVVFEDELEVGFPQ